MLKRFIFIIGFFSLIFISFDTFGGERELTFRRGERIKKLQEIREKFQQRKKWMTAESQDIPFFDTVGKKVKRIKTIIHTQAGHIDWLAKTSQIAFSKKGDDGYSDTWVMDSDGSNQKCLTCDKEEVTQKNNGQPAWHPSGDYIVIQVQNPQLGGPDQLAREGVGIHNNIWVMTSDGSKFYQFTDVKYSMGVLHPHFSHDGKKLFWAERIGRGGTWGEFAIMLADFVVDNTGPHLENKKIFQPMGMDKATYYETHGFSLDDTKIIFSADIGRDSVYEADIWTMDVETGKIAQLIDTAGEWDEHAHYWPDGKEIIWISSRGHPLPKNPSRNWGEWLVTDYWKMNADGSNQERLTYFNDPSAPEYVGDGGKVIVADSSFSPDGKRSIFCCAIIFNDGRMAHSIALIEF